MRKAHEIVNDIENRFAELFSDRLKKGATCITDADLDEIISSMVVRKILIRTKISMQQAAQIANFFITIYRRSCNRRTRRLYRSENDKCWRCLVPGGLPEIDPSVVRIIYALLILGSFGTAYYYTLFYGLPFLQIHGFKN